MKVIQVLVAPLVAVLLLVMPGAATAGSGSITDPAGDMVVESPGTGPGVDISGATITNGANAITVKVAFHNVEPYDVDGELVWPDMDTTVTMKWGSGARRSCSFSNTLVGASGLCGGDMPLLQGCGSIRDGNPQVIKIPRRCVGSAADSLKFRIVTVHQQSVCVNCGEDAELLRTKDTTAWSRVIRRTARPS